MPSAGGQVPTQMVAPASASALAMANPKPPSSGIPGTKTRLPERSMHSVMRLSPICETAGESRAERSDQRADFVRRPHRDAQRIAELGDVEIPDEHALLLERFL